MLLPITEPGTIRGTLLPQIARETGVGEVPVVAVAGHDTASAVAAVPAQDDDFAYISSGTWSLVGIETLKPVISDEAQAANLTNEGGVDGTIRVLKNVMGLWIIQECQREWERRGKKLSFAEIVKEAEKELAFRSLFDPDDDGFMTPGDMPGKIADYCCRTGQPVPETIGQMARAVYESLALKYRWTVKKLEKVRGKEICALHIVGGGSNNAMLNQFTSDALGIPVITGPSEATAIGNLMMQAKALGLVTVSYTHLDVYKRQVIKAVEQIHKRGFARRSRAENGKGRACRNGEGDVLEHRHAIIVSKGHMIEHDILHQIRLDGIRAVMLFFGGHDVVDSVDGNARFGHIRDYAAQLANWPG